jgi:hypothetical protein
MNLRRLAALVALSLAQGVGSAARAEDPPSPAAERELNVWPFMVKHRPNGAENTRGWNVAGPLLFSQPAADPAGNTATGFRPFWVQFSNDQGDLRSGHFLFPLFSYSQDEATYKWSVFEMIRRQGRRAGAPRSEFDFDPRHAFEVFPFWFERDFAAPELNYRAFFPVRGTLRHRLGFERVSWTLFPFFVENERRGAITTHTPWPIVRVTHGDAHGWGVWPLYSTVERPGVSSETYYLWPLIYNVSRQPTPDDPPGTPPRRDTGVLPFYASSAGSGFVSESYVWPLFGYSERTQPVRYSERRYLWPLFVQGRGEERYINRWAPFYTHSMVKGYDKQWLAWPLLRQAQWIDEGIERTRSQLLYFLYWHEGQRAAGRANAPTAGLTHVWPLFSHWNNGAGRRQWQLFSPLEVFFPGNDKIRQIWSPLLALARHDERASGDTHTAWLWNAVTWEKRVTEDRREFHLGPLLGVTRVGGDKRVVFGNGLLGFHRPAGGGWRMFWLDSPAKSDRNSTASR